MVEFGLPGPTMHKVDEHIRLSDLEELTALLRAVHRGLSGGQVMADGFIGAVKSIVNYRGKSGVPFDPANVAGGHAATGIGLNILVQAALVRGALLGCWPVHWWRCCRIWRW